MKLAAVMVAYNPTEYVFKNIESYLDSVDILYVIDNSDGDNAELFKHKKIFYHSNGKNAGIASALNMGANMAIKDGYDWLLTMDQDSRFDSKDSVDKMKDFVSFIESNECVPFLFGIDRKKVGIVSPFHITAENIAERPRGYNVIEIAMTSGNVVSLSAFKETGGYSDDFFIDAVDFDFCLNIRDHGYDIIRLNYVRLNHELGNPLFKRILGKKICSLNHNYIRDYYIVRNRLYLYDSYVAKFPEFCKAEKKRTLKEAIKILFIENDKMRKIRSMRRGYKDYKNGVKGAIPQEYI